MANNYTPLDDTIQKEKAQAVSYHKEAGPGSPKKEAYDFNEVVEHEPPDEVKPYVESRQETVKITKDLKKMGVASTGTSKFPTYQNIKLPLSDDKIVTGLHAPVTSSLRWLALLATYILRLSHLKLKVIHGQVVRVLIRG